MNTHPTNETKIAEAVKTILNSIGEDEHRPGLQETPHRVARAWKEFARGYTRFPGAVSTFPSAYQGIVLRQCIPFSSMCEHHLLPYTGTIDFAYVPNGKVIGISKIIRLFQHFAARLTIQEELTEYVAKEFSKLLQPRGCAVRIGALHSCESTRGVRQQGVSTVTFYFSGCFEEDRAFATQFLSMLRNDMAVPERIYGSKKA